MDIATRQRKEKNIWEKTATTYDSKNIEKYRDTYRLTVEKILSVVKPHHHVLEIGCGTGIVTCEVAPHIEKMVAVDISQAMMAELNGKLEERSIRNVESVVFDGYSLPYDTGAFDVVLLINILQCVSEPQTLLKEANRLLKHEGILCSAIDCYADPLPFPLVLQRPLLKLMKMLDVYPCVNFFRKEDVVSLFEQSSFRVLQDAVLYPAPLNEYLLAVKD